MGWKATPTWASQYGLPVCTGRPQNQKSSVAGSPTGHLQVRSVSSISDSRLAFFSISLTLARASGSISLAEGCGGSGWPAGMMALMRTGAFAGSASSPLASAGAEGLAAGFGAGLAAAFGASASGAAAGAAFATGAEPLRLDSPSRCTLPITALRVTPPSSLAIWLADWPSPHNLFNRSTRSSLHDIRGFPCIERRPGPVCPAALSSGSASYSNHSTMSYKASNRDAQRRQEPAMTDPASSAPLPMGARRFGRVNWLGLRTLAERENRRFLAVWTQTLLAPLITAGRFMVIFSIAIGPRRGDVMGADFTTFIAPGILMMTVIQNAFANTSSSIVISKVQGNIVDTLMPPLSAGELVLGYMAGGVGRGVLVALAITLGQFAVLGLVPAHPIWMMVFVVLGAAFLSGLGMVAGIFANKFDQMAAITNFVVTPLAFLSGTFYSVQALPPLLNKITHFNPIFYMIDGVRYGMLGISDSSPWLGLCVGVGATVAISITSWWMFARGYRLKA